MPLQQTSKAIRAVEQHLSRSGDFKEIKLIRAQLAILRLEAKGHPTGAKLVRKVAELRLVADRKLGGLLAAMPLKGGDRRSSKAVKAVPTLQKFGLSRSQSSRFQREALVSGRDFRRYLRQAANEDTEPTVNGLLRLGYAGSSSGPFSEYVTALRSLAARGKKFKCIFIVPPAEVATPDELHVLSKLRLEEVAAANAHLHLWIEPEALAAGLRLLKEWGFRYASSLAWAATPTTGGAYWQSAHRNLLLGVRGHLRFRDNRTPSAISGRSGTPEALRRLIQRVSPGPRLDMFGSRTARGWTLASSAMVSR